MGREIKRVPLDFDWPLNVIWRGYINPYRPTKCAACDGSGLNSATKALSDDWHKHTGGSGWQHALEQPEVDALIEAGRLRDLTDRWLDGKWVPTGRVLSVAEVNAWSRRGFGHDAINQWICVKSRAARLGILGYCALCGGRGRYWCDDRFEDLWDNWQAVEPPAGDGWQLWENVSEGSPISPVFVAREDFVLWLTVDGKASREQAERFCEQGFSFSMIVRDGVIDTGIAAL